MKNMQRSLRAIALLALFMMTMSIFAQEATEEPVTDTQEVTEEPMMETEATEEAMVEPEATEAPMIEPEVTEEPMVDTDDSSMIEEVAGTSISVIGSGVVNPAVEALIGASGSILDYTLTTTGSTAGIAALCANEADIATSIRPINVEEDATCRDAGVEYIELLIAYDVLTVIANPADSFATCLTADNLTTLFAPSATISNWGDFVTPDTTTGNAEATEEPMMSPDITVLLPQDTSLTYENLDGIVSGFGFRADAQLLDNAGIVAGVSSTSGAIGVVPLSVAMTAGESISIVDINLVGVCASPSITTVESGQYPAATPFYLYVANNAQDDLAFLLDYATGLDASTALGDAGYTAVSAESLSLNAAIVRGDVSARATTAEEITYTIPQGLSGNISVVGASSGFGIASTTSTRLTETQQSLVIDNNFSGQTAGVEAFCNGTADVLFVEGDTSTLCDGNVDFVDYNFGTQAVVLVANPDDSFATCLTPAQVNTIWGASAGEPITQWSGVSDAFPEQDLILVGLNSGNPLTDIMLGSVADGVPLPVRDDVAETNSDPLYRATAVSIVSGALSYMSWVDYQDVVDSAAVQLVAINTGDGCVVPSEASILDGTYPMTRNVRMVVKQSSLATIPVQSYVWSVFGDGNISLINALDFVGGFQDQETITFRSDLLADFATAEQAVAEASAEVTPEAESTDE